jgi:hypothetical protein
MQQPGLGWLELAAVAAAALGIEEQIVPLQQLGDVSLERDEIRRIFCVAADGDRAGDMAVEQAQRATEQVDAGSDDRRAYPEIVEHQGLDQIVRMTAVVRRVNDAP